MVISKKVVFVDIHDDQKNETKNIPALYMTHAFLLSEKNILQVINKNM